MMGAGMKAKELLTDRDIKQKGLADYLHLAESGVSNYLNEKREMPHKTLVQVAEYLKTTTDYLLGRTPNPYVPITLSREEQDLIAKLRVLTGADRQVVTKLVEFLEERETR